MTHTERTPSATAQRILDAALRLFNEKGYAAVTLTEIAQSVGIAQGNLTYHFPTKQALVDTLREQGRRRIAERRAALEPSDVVDDYVEHLRFAMDLTWNMRFLLLDAGLFGGDDESTGPSPELVADFDELGQLLQRVRDEGMFRSADDFDLDRLTRSLWVVSRYWMDHLREMEGRREITWPDQLAGIEHHLALLKPHLTAAAQRRFSAAIEQTEPPPLGE